MKNISLMFVLAWYLVSYRTLLTSQNIPILKDVPSGPYVIKLNSAVVCRGPKAKNLTQSVVYDKKIGDKKVVFFNFTILTSFKIESIKLSFYMVKNKVTAPVGEFKTNDPCHSFILKPVLLHFADSSCGFKAGTNYAEDFDVDQLSKVTFGGSLYYGHYIVRSLGLNRKGNLFCIELDLQSLPPKI